MQNTMNGNLNDTKSSNQGLFDGNDHSHQLDGILGSDSNESSESSLNDHQYNSSIFGNQLNGHLMSQADHHFVQQSQPEKRKLEEMVSINGIAANGEPVAKKTPPANGKKTKGRVKIKMEFIDNKLRRYTTFSKRKTGIMKKAYELSTLTGTQVMLLVASETGHVYTFATRKLQPMITSEAGKALIQTCLNSPDPPNSGHDHQRMSATGFEETDLTYTINDDDQDDKDEDDDEKESSSNATQIMQTAVNQSNGLAVSTSEFVPSINDHITTSIPNNPLSSSSALPYTNCKTAYIYFTQPK